jgi:oligopeptide/dipeptide ABC transporter ATP-binding protein
LILDPEVLILDEPVSALDVSVQAQVINLLLDLQQARQLSCLVILHDLAVATQMCDRIAVVYLGKIVEEGPAEHVLQHPLHPYAQGLLAAAPRLGTALAEVDGTLVPEGDASPAAKDAHGCRFRNRCYLGSTAEVCSDTEPALRHLGGEGQYVACHLTTSEPPVDWSTCGRSEKHV